MRKLTDTEVLKLTVGTKVVITSNAPNKLDFYPYNSEVFDLVSLAIKNGTPLIIKGVVDMDVLSNVLYLLTIDDTDPNYVVFPTTGWGLAVQTPEDTKDFVWVFSDYINGVCLNDVYVED